MALDVPCGNAFLPVLGQLHERGGRTVASERLHLTVAFMGAVPPDDAAAVPDIVCRVATRHEPFGLSTTGRLRRFGEAVVWAEVTADHRAEQFVGALNHELMAEGIEVAQRRFRPHVTLARAGRRRIRSSTLAGLEAPTMEWVVDHVALRESRLGAGGAHWTTLRFCPLSGEGA